MSKHAVDWSYHSLTPCDYKDFVADSTLEGAEHLGAQAIAVVIFFTLAISLKFLLIFF